MDFIFYQGKQVFYNDYLKFNHTIGLALIENNNAVLDNKKNNIAFQNDVFDWDYTTPDLVYFDFYHFLEGIVKYDEWPNLIDHNLFTTIQHKRNSNYP